MKEIASENLSAFESRYLATAMVVSAQTVFSIILTNAIRLLATRAANSISRQTQMTLRAATIFLADAGTSFLRRMFFRSGRFKDAAVLKGVTRVLETLQNNAIILSVFATLLTVVGCVIIVLGGETCEAILAQIVAPIVLSVNFPC